MHAAGMHHEQSRDDRDRYIKIFYDNIVGGTENKNMNIWPTYDRYPYDAESVLQYGLYVSLQWLIDCLVDSVLFENISSINGRLRNRWTKGCNIKAYFGLFFTILSRTSSMMPSDSDGFNILIFVTNDNVCLVSESNSLLLFLLWNSGPGNEREPADNGAPGQTAGVPARHVAEPLLLWRSGDHQGLSVHR